MQRTWRRAWLRGKPYYMRHKPVRKARTGSIKDKVYDLTVKAAKKLAPAAAAAGIFLCSLAGVQANPTGGSISAGTGSITGQGTNSVTINQTSDKLAVNWNSFSIGSGEKVQFIQPGASSIALNRVLGTNASAIYGQLSANGKVFILNPNGVLFAKGAQVNVGGLVASTLKLSDQDFMNGKYSFSGDSQQGVLNQGNITVANGGYAALLGANAANEGVILAREGTVALGAGSKITLDFTGDGLLTLSVDESKVKAEVKNSGLIKADGGLVVMNAKAADALTGSVVNNTGTIEARSVTSKNGRIILSGDTVINTDTLDASGKNSGETGGTVKVLGDSVKLASGSSIDVSGDNGGGTALIGGAYQGGSSEYAATKTVVEQGTSINADALTAGNGGQVVVWANDTTSFAGGISAKGGQNSGDGGSVETSGKRILTVADTAKVNTTAANGKTGNWLLDPADFVVAASGSDITGATVAGWLADNNVTIQTTDSGSSTSGGAGQSATGASGTAGNININDTITWASDTTLTLSAYNNIYINRSVTNTGAGSLALEYGQKSVSSGNTSSYAINAPVNLTAGQHFSTKLGSDGAVKHFTVITSLGSQGSITGIDLQGMQGNLSGNYFLGADIDASTTSAWNPWSYNGNSGYFGFDPIGDYNNKFTGCFDGGGHTISGLTINRSGTSYVGLFASTDASADIRNVGLVGGSVSGSDTVGGLVGFNSGSITNSYNSGSVTGTQWTGGLVGYQQSGSITNSYNSGSVIGSGTVGGLVGNSYISSITNSYNSGSISGSSSVGGLAGYASGSIENSYNSGSVSGTSSVGGLAGTNWSTIKNSYNSGSVNGNVSGSSNIGGLVGSTQNDSIITNSYNSASVTGVDKVGGLVGDDYFGEITNSYNSGSVNGSADVGGIGGYYTGAIKNSYNSGSVTGVDKVGGLVGRKSNSGSITNSYNSGNVTGSAAVGGIVGSGSYSITGSFYATTNASGGSINNGGTYDSVVWSGNVNGTGITLAKMQSTSFWTTGEGSTWSVDTAGGADKIWRVYDGHTTPLLKSFLTKTTVNADNKSKTYDGTVYSGSPTNVTYASGTDFSLLLGTDNPTYGNARNAGTYGLDLYSVQHGYDIVYETGMLTINKADLTASLTGTVTKIYNGNDTATLTGGNYSLSGLVGGDTVTVSGTGAYNDKNAGTGKTVTADGLTLGGADAGNYNLTSSTATANIGTITPKTLTAYLTGSATKTYDGTTAATLAASNYSALAGIIGGDAVSLNIATSGSYADKNAGNGKSVTVDGLSLSGAGAGNYQLASTSISGNVGRITPKTLTAALTGSAAKTYDGTTAATLTGGNYSALTGIIGGDAVSLNIATSASYADKNAGSGKAVTVNGLSLSGAGAGNYQLASTSISGNIGEITPKTLTAALTGSVTKTYDGTTAATLAASNYSALAGIIGGDAVSLTIATSGSYADKNAGSDKSVTVDGLSLNGAGAGNYQLASTSISGNIGQITPKTLTAALTGSVTKTYDGTAAATLTGGNYSALTGIIGGDAVSLNIATSGSYADKNAGSGKAVTVNGLSLSGAGAGNYQLASTSISGNIGTIDKAALTITAAANTKTYDGTTTAAATPTYSGLQTGDSLAGLAEAYTDKNAGSGKTLRVSSGYTLNDGNNGNNYTVTLVENTTGTIDKTALTVTAKNAEKTYDKLAYEGGNDVTFDGFVNGENRDVLNGSLTYGGTAQGATEVGTYTIISAGLTSTNYTITFRDGTLTIKAATSPNPSSNPGPGYTAAVQNRQQSAANNAAGAGGSHSYPPAANAASPQLPAGQASPIQYSGDTAGTPRVITTAGQTVTIAQDSLLQLATNPVQKEIAVYQTISGGSALAGVYQVDGSQGALALRRSEASFAPVPPAMPAPAAAQAETASFQLTDPQGNTANFTVAYTNGSLYVQAANVPAADILSQNRQLVTAASLVAVQDKLGLDINNLQAVYLGK